MMKFLGRIGSGAAKYSLCVFSLLSPAWAVQDNQEAICDQPWVIFCDNFEARPANTGTGALAPATYKNGGWLCSNQSHYIGNDPVGVDSGSNAYFVPYPAGTWTEGPDANGGSGYCDGALIDGTQTHVFARYYEKISSNFVFSGSDKWTRLVTAYGNSLFVRIYGQDGVYTNDGNLIATGQPLSSGVWHCIEREYQAPSSNTSADGIVRLWVDGVQLINVTNESDTNVDQGGVPGAGHQIQYFEVDSTWNVGPAPDWPDGHPLQYRYVDNIVVGTQRIGCLGTPPPSDTTPPAAPGGLRLN